MARRLHLVASWLVARWFLGGELVGGEIPWWRGNRIPDGHNLSIRPFLARG